jgi:hypothetical protein
METNLNHTAIGMKIPMAAWLRLVPKDAFRKLGKGKYKIQI